MNKTHYKMDSPLEIGNRIYSCRTKLKITQEELSEYIGCTPNYIGQLERGTKTLSLSMAERMCRFFGISYDYLLLGKNPADNLSVNDLEDDILQLITQLSPKEQSLCYRVLKDIIIQCRAAQME